MIDQEMIDNQALHFYLRRPVVLEDPEETFLMQGKNCDIYIDHSW